MIQEKRAAIYCRVSTDDQNCQRQLRDLKAFAKKANYTVVEIFQETASGARSDRIERAKVLKLAQSRKIEAILVTELSRWGRSTIDLLQTLEQLNNWNISVIAQTGNQFDLSNAQGKMITGILSVLSQFERDLISERTKSGLQAAIARGKKLGRQPGQNPSDKYAKEVLRHISNGRSYRWIAYEMQISPTTVMAIARRYKNSTKNTKLGAA